MFFLCQDSPFLKLDVFFVRYIEIFRMIFRNKAGCLEV